MNTDSFSQLQDKIAKFEDADVKERTKTLNKDQILQQKINDREKEWKESVRRKFDSYVMPLSREVEYAEKQLVTAFKLYCALKEINQKTGSEKEYVNFDLVSPFLQSPQFTGDDFVYLQIWFVRCSGTGDSNFVPVRLEQKSGSKIYTLSFVKKENFKADINMKEILAALD